MFPLDSKILIVDDSSFLLNNLKTALKELKYWKILEAKQARLAQGLMMEEEQIKDPVHLIITDLHMPDLSGLEFVRWVRTRDKQVPVIVLTSSQEKTEIIEAGKLGVSHYMIKPFDTTTLKSKMESTFLKHGQKYIEGLKSASASAGK